MADNNRKQEIQMIISDIIMPKMNGHELHKKIIQLRPNIKVLYISGFTENGIDNKDLLQEGVNFLQKPFSLKILVTRVRQILDA